MQPNITISTVDLHRLDLLLDRLPAAQSGTRDRLADELARAAVVEPWNMPPRVVTMNSTVRFRLVGAGAEFCRTLAYPKDLGADGERMSVLSPVGSALLGLAEGDRIDWVHPDGQAIGVEVLEVVWQPERAGAFHL
jgi:regulator of nucleoside diphosphate kinase